MFSSKLLIIIGFVFLLAFSVYNYASNNNLKEDNIKLNNLLSKTVKLLTPTPTIKLSPTSSPTPTSKPILSEYIFIPLPHSGVVYSCKRVSENIISEASLALKSASEDRAKCIVEKKGKVDIFAMQKVYADCSKTTTEASNKLMAIIKDNCIGGSNSQDSQTLRADP